MVETATVIVTVIVIVTETETETEIEIETDIVPIVSVLDLALLIVATPSVPVLALLNRLADLAWRCPIH